MHGALWNGLPGKAGSCFWKGKFEPFFLNINRNITIKSHLYYKLNWILFQWFPDGWIHTESSKFKLRMVFKNLILRLIFFFFSENAECPLTSSCAYSANEWHIDPPQRSSALCRTEHICSKANLSAPSFQQGCVKVPRKNQQQLSSVTWNHCSTWASWRLRNDLATTSLYGEKYIQSHQVEGPYNRVKF